jgi:hypothetical protein
VIAVKAAALGGLLTALTAVIVSACHPDRIYCDLPINPFPLQVNVRDSVTGRWVALGAWGTVDAPGIHDTLINFGNDTLTLYARNGAAAVYRVDLHRDGYQDWTVSGVKVEGGECGPASVLVNARLQPMP